MWYVLCVLATYACDDSCTYLSSSRVGHACGRRLMGESKLFGMTNIVSKLSVNVVSKLFRFLYCVLRDVYCALCGLSEPVLLSAIGLCLWYTS